MKIASISAALPSRLVSNDEVLDLIRLYSHEQFDGDLEAALRQIGFFLSYTGSDTRRWRALNEQPIDLVTSAIRSACEKAGLLLKEVDLLIYTGIGRGFAEPGQAYHIADALGISPQCFDLIDACMSWTRALQISQHMIGDKQFCNICIVNAEFNLGHGGAVFPGVFQLASSEMIAWSFPAYTLGEAATATIVTADNEHWPFVFVSRPDLAELCNVPTHGYTGYAKTSEKIGKNGEGQFTSFGFELHAKGNPEILECYNRLQLGPHDIDIAFTHASSKREWQGLADSLGIGEKVFHIFQDTGNLVSASIPAAISAALDSGALNRGDRALIWAGSAGMSFAASHFTY